MGPRRARGTGRIPLLKCLCPHRPQNEITSTCQPRSDASSDSRAVPGPVYGRAPSFRPNPPPQSIPNRRRSLALDVVSASCVKVLWTTSYNPRVLSPGRRPHFRIASLESSLRLRQSLRSVHWGPDVYLLSSPSEERSFKCTK